MFRPRRHDTQPGEPITAPTNCPQCGSTKVTTTNKPITASTYWRCESCGEIWNEGRRLPGRHYTR